MSSGNIILKLWKIKHHLPPKLICCQKTDCPMDGNCHSLNALFKKHLLVQLLINITMVLVKIFSKNVTITRNIYLQINLVKRTLNCPSMYGIWKRKIRIILLIRILLRKRRNMFVNFESLIYVFVRNSLLQEQILMFCSINVMSLSQNASIETSLVWSASNVEKIIYTLRCM